MLLSHVRFFVTPWTIAHRLLCPWGFSRQEYWSGLPVPSPGDLSNPGIESRSLHIAESLPSEPPGKPHKLSGLHQIQSINSITHQLKSTCISHGMAKKLPIQKKKVEIFVSTFLVKERGIASEVITPWLKSCHRTGHD